MGIWWDITGDITNNMICGCPKKKIYIANAWPCSWRNDDQPVTLRWISQNTSGCLSMFEGWQVRHFLFGETMSLWFSLKAMGIQINQPLIETYINRYTGRYVQTLQFFTGNIKWSFQLELSALYFRQTHFFKGSIYFCSLCVGVDWGMDP